MSGLVEVKGYYRGTTSTTEFSAIYSLKNRKFVKGFFKGDRVSGEILYRLYPGRYLRFTYYGWWRMDPPRTLTVTLFELQPDGTEKALASATVKFYNKEFIEKLGIPQVADFFNGRPHYHRYPSIDFNKTYSEEDNEKLLNFVMSKKEVVEGEEHE